MSRYDALFARLDADGAGAFVPFVMLGDPDIETSHAIITALIDGGADALELGVPFTDPVADGPTIQKAHIRATDAGVDLPGALGLVTRIRSEHPDLPIGLLVYGNVAFARGLDTFYRMLAESGADSVLIPDVPVREGAPFKEMATRHGIDQIFIAPPHASEATLAGVAANSSGYIYAVSRVGVTGAENQAGTDGLAEVVHYLTQFGGAPALLGFGISTPGHVDAAIAAGAAGAISGSAITAIIERHCVGEHPDPVHVENLSALTDELTAFTKGMKAATTRT